MALVRATSVLLVVQVHAFLVCLVRHLVLSFSVTSHLRLDLAQLIVLIILVSTCLIGLGVLRVIFLQVLGINLALHSVLLIQIEEVSDLSLLIEVESLL